MQSWCDPIDDQQVAVHFSQNLERLIGLADHVTRFSVVLRHFRSVYAKQRPQAIDTFSIDLRPPCRTGRSRRLVFGRLASFQPSLREKVTKKGHSCRGLLDGNLTRRRSSLSFAAKAISAHDFAKHTSYSERPIRQ